MTKKKVEIKSQLKSKIKIEYVLAVFLIVLVFALFLNNGSIFSKLFTNNATENSINSEDEKISEILSKIEGVGKVSATITYKDSGFTEVLKNVEIKVENGVKTTIESAVLINGKPYVINQHTPAVEGILVVCEGANEIKVKIEITEVLKTIYNVSSDKIKILKMK